MKTTLVLAALLGLLAAVPASAGRPHPERAKIAHLSREVRTLRHRLHNMTLVRNQVKAQLTSAQTEVTGLQSALSEANARADALQARLSAIPGPLAAAEQYLSRVIWAAEATDPARPAGEIVALAAMNYVADNHVNLFMRSYLLEHGGMPAPPWTADTILGSQAGLCGQAAFVFATLVRSFGFQVRSVSFYYDDPPGSPNGHSANEVYYDDGWHYFDPTFGLYYTDANGNVLDIATARASGGSSTRTTICSST